MEQDRWLDLVIELQSLAQAGLTYGKDVYDRERYLRIREIAAELLAGGTALPVETVTGLFCNETGYQTPKLDTRAAIFQDDRILLVRENSSEWALLGGWCDVNASVGENFVQCAAAGGQFEKNSETTASGYFAEDGLPPLCRAKNTEEQIRMCFAARRDAYWKPLLD